MLLFDRPNNIIGNHIYMLRYHHLLIFPTVPPAQILINSQSSNNPTSLTKPVFAGISYSLTCAVPGARPPPEISWRVPSDRAIIETVTEQVNEVRGNLYHSSKRLDIAPTIGEDIIVDCEVSHRELSGTMIAPIRLEVHVLVQNCSCNVLRTSS